MSQHNRTPFDNLLGQYIFPPNIRHDRLHKETFLFVGSCWQKVGDIEFVYTRFDEEHGTVEIHFPDVGQYAIDHEQEGALDWMRWGASIN